MRLVTRCDLDGLTSAVLIGLNEDVNEILLTHPQEIADGQVEIGPQDILANLPYRSGCGMWFDHHMHSATRAPRERFRGAFGRAPSAARLVYEYYGGKMNLADFEKLVEETDRFDSAKLDLDDILDPQGYIRLGFTLDDRSGLGRSLEYFMTVHDLLSRKTPIDRVLAHPEVEERCQRLEDEDTELHAALVTHSRREGNVLVTDFRSLAKVPVGNRFLVFALFPDINVAVRVERGPEPGSVEVRLGHSVVNRTCSSNLGELAARYGGGGHPGAASVRLEGEIEQKLAAIIGDLEASC